MKKERDRENFKAENIK